MIRDCTDGQRRALRDVRDALRSLSLPARGTITPERMEVILREQRRLATWALGELDREFGLGDRRRGDAPSRPQEPQP